MSPDGALIAVGGRVAQWAATEPAGPDQAVRPRNATLLYLAEDVNCPVF